MRVKPWEDLDLETHWGWLPVEGKVVLDVGADYGSTADFFLARGAAQVIAVEGDPRSCRRLQALAEERENLTAVQMRVASVDDWRQLLGRHAPQVVKADCEGGEYWLLDLEDDVFRRPQVWAVELHTKEQAERWGNPVPWSGVDTLHVRFLEKLFDCGYDIAKDVPHMAGRVVCGVRGDFLLSDRPGISESRTSAVIVSTQRSGTRLLEECLASHPDVEIGGELLRETPPWPTRVLADFFDGGEADVRLCRLMYNQLTPAAIMWLQMHEVRVIHLIRQDHVRREVSNWINRHREGLGRASAHSFEEVEPVQVEVDIPWLLKRIQVVEAQIEGFRKLFETGEYLEVTYEDLVGWEGQEISELSKDLDAKLLRFLELTPHPLTTTLRKQNPGDLASFVLNYDQLMAAIWKPCDFDAAFVRRDYPTYQAYVEKQVSKLETLDLSQYDARFRRELRGRIESLDFLPRGTTVLCLGARSGAEVAAFLDRGCAALGIDLNPGEDNALVEKGDFHDIPFEADSADVIFTNSLDHAFDVRKVIAEMRRVLKPDGFLIVEAVPGLEEGAHLDAWDCFCWKTRDDLVALFEEHGFELIKRSQFDFPWRGEQLCFERGNWSTKREPL